jgi:hypothetical protein
MEIKLYEYRHPKDISSPLPCMHCNGTRVEADMVTVCVLCGGSGVSPRQIGVIDATDVDDKLQELKTKVNQLQADINYIKAKVG